MIELFSIFPLKSRINAKKIVPLILLYTFVIQLFRIFT